uniref:F-box domain-containing protein n=1 Tax=Chromera velia CCMP2878 TaxID=1169474 RepID=A0A0G4FDI7_9ALVE|eukprot:Cvel_16343.t1-p1 / transcript=Cvel_16343.t1 / gene=Cvel_16343 / organism=Chromera_velia_CCMP2878 / gene_product=hypothetical protein / transcript_product=hypothetical protein / location=Cvel_scaffold1254:44805-46253(+) / protein_length=348 / sequence_SO=supercontig / SO=protein_coding / is_pseudo=false
MDAATLMTEEAERNAGDPTESVEVAEKEPHGEEDQKEEEEEKNPESLLCMQEENVFIYSVLPFLDPFELTHLRVLCRAHLRHLREALNLGVRCDGEEEMDAVEETSTQVDGQGEGVDWRQMNANVMKGSNGGGGCFYKIGTKFDAQPWQLRTVSSLVSIASGRELKEWTLCPWTGVSQDGGEYRWNNPVVNLLNFRESRRVFQSGSSCFFAIDLGPFMRIAPTGYWMRHGSSQRRAPRFWRLEALEGVDSLKTEETGDESGEEKDEKWTLLMRHVDDRSIGPEGGSSARFDLGEEKLKELEGKRFKMFRLVKEGGSAAQTNDPYLHVNGFELFGTLFFNHENSEARIC